MRRGAAGVLLLLTIIVLSIYSNTFSVPFHFDDYIRIVENEDVHITRFTQDNIIKLASLERPVAMASFALNYYFSGLDLFGYHLVNIAVHILTALGLFLLLDLTLFTSFKWPEDKRFLASLFASLLWATNPIQIQGVTYIVQRMASMAALFYVYSVLFYVKGRSSAGGRRVAYFMFFVLFGLFAFGTKANSFNLPFIIILYELCIIRKGDLSLIKERSFYLSVLAVSAVFLIVSTILYPEEIRSYLSPYPGMGYVIKERLFTQARVFFLYISIFFFPLPSRLCIEPDPGLSRALFSPPTTAFAVAGVFSIAAFAILFIKKRAFHSFFLFWILGNFAIESFHVGLKVMYEHRMYLPSMGVAAIAGKAFVDVLYCKGWYKFFLPGIVFIFFSINAYARNAVWRDPLSLWADAVKKAPYSVTAHLGLGLTFLNKGQIEEAIEELKKAKEINPRDAYLRYYLGVAFYDWKVYDKAIIEFRAVWNMGVDSPVGKPMIDTYFYAIARSFIAHGDIEKGRELLKEAGRFHPENIKVKDMLEKLESSKLTGEDLRPEGW